MSRHLERGQREYKKLMGSPPEEGLADVRLRSPQMYGLPLIPEGESDEGAHCYRPA